MAVSLNAAETANDLIKGEILANYYTEHQNMGAPRTQTRQVDHDIATFNAQGDVHYVVFHVVWNAVGNVLLNKDLLNLRYRLYSLGGAGEVASVRVHRMSITFRTKYASAPYKGVVPPEG